MELEHIVLNEERNVTLDALTLSVGGEFEPIRKRPAVLILPGGGYATCSDREADPVAGGFFKAGYQVFILRYSLGEHKTWPNPLEDYEQAMTMIRTNEAWHVDGDRVAVIGFSAGGHLAACAATMADQRPNAAILCYAAVTNALSEFLQPGAPHPIEHIDERTPACFLAAVRDDLQVSVTNVLEFEAELVKHNITFESHIYSYGGHGFNSGERWSNSSFLSRGVPNWVGESIRWLEELWGVFDIHGFTMPTLDRVVDADKAEYLSARCTIGHLKKQSGEVLQICAEGLQLVDGIIASAMGDSDGARAVIYNMYTFRDALLAFHVSPEKVKRLDAELRKMPNTVK